MAKEVPQADQDWLFLDHLITLCDEQSKIANQVKEDIDDPEILKSVMALESNALILWKLVRDYRDRLTLLKRLASGNGLDILEEIQSLADKINELAGGHDPPVNTTGNGSPKKNRLTGGTVSLMKNK